LSRIVERYWDEHATPGDSLSAQYLADALALERRFLAEMLAVPRGSLDAESQLTYDIFKRQREQSIEGLTYPVELLPVDPIDGPWLQFAQAAADTRQHPFKSAKDYENWLLRIDGQVRWAHQAIVNMREGMRRGYTSPRPLMEAALPLLQALSDDTSANVFYLPQRSIPDSLAEPEYARLSSVLDSAVKDRLLPAYRGLHDFIREDYLPRSRQSLALSALPLGTPWYASLLKRATGSQLTAGEIHAIGLAEVERLRARLKALPAAPAPAPATAPAPAPAAAPPAETGELQAAYEDLKVQTLAALPTLFSLAPRADFEIRTFDPIGDGAPALGYRSAAPDGRTKAILWVAIDPRGTRPAVTIAGFLREAIPGRHFQSALQLERVELPKFRRFGADRGFQDGWALYAASLGEELGLYRDDDARRGAVLSQLTCAAASVVDTGLQSAGWTQRQAVEYLRTELALDEAGAAGMTDRFLAAPADAVACTIGERKFQALRAQAQQALGTRFDIREFHAEVLKDGAMPLDILEAKIRLWMNGR